MHAVISRGADSTGERQGLTRRARGGARASAVVGLLATAGLGMTGAPGVADSPRDCHLAGAKLILRDAAVFVHRTGSRRRPRYTGCLSAVGRHHRLPLAARRLERRKAALLMGAEPWLGFPARGRGGRPRVAAINLRTGKRHGADAVGRAARATAVLALVVNSDGSLAWIAQRGKTRELRLRSPAQAGSTLVHSGGGIGRFLTLDDSGCVFNWKLDREMRGTSLSCTWP